MKKTVGDVATLYELEWDTNYFGIKSAKAILHKPLALEQWGKLKIMFQEYGFVSIYNRNSEPVNAQYIGKDTCAFLADINIQFSKKLNCNCVPDESITINQAMEKNNQVLRIADFPYSKFTEDPGLAALGGAQVYYQWLLNSFEKPNKFYALSKDQKGDVDGYLLHSYSNGVCIVELIAVSKDSVAGGIGTRLFKAVEHSAFQKGCKEIRVGTQVRNMGAINFYHKIGCKQVGCHQVYHLWRKSSN